MNLNCPYCGETIPYDPSLAGQPVQCSYCDNAIQMPSVDELPEELREEVRREEANRQQTQQRKYQRKQQRYLREIEREEKRKVPQKRPSYSHWSSVLLGRSEEMPFRLMPGESVIDELVISHRLFFIFPRGVTRVTLTNSRLLYHATNIFSPIYWILLALFPPLIFHYAFRLQRNRYLSVPLSRIDSIEKAYRANRLVLMVCVVAVAGLYSLTAGLAAWHPSRWEAMGQFGWFLSWGIWILSGPITLFSLLKTRIFGVQVRSMNNVFFASVGAVDEGVSRARCDSFIQKVSVQIERVGKRTE